MRRRRGKLLAIAWSLASATIAVGMVGLATGSSIPRSDALVTAGSRTDTRVTASADGSATTASLAQGIATRTGGADFGSTPTASIDMVEDEATFGPTPVFATVASAELRLPSPHPVLVAYHEASNDHGFALAPVGRILTNRNPTRTAPIADAGEVEFMILSSRGRTAPATSAVDVVLEADDVVLAPINGVVVDVRWYLLYGRHLDRRVEIAPHGRDDLRIVVLHVEDLLVTEGDELEGGVTPLAMRARRLPFSSHVDREVAGGRLPHVHIEAVGPDALRPEPVGG